MADDPTAEPRIMVDLDGDTLSLIACSRCGALVDAAYTFKTHMEWHADLDGPVSW